MKIEKDISIGIELIIDNFEKLKESIKANRRKLLQSGMNYSIIISSIFIIEEELMKHRKDIKL